MGRGNVHPDGPYEGVFYIDNDYLHVYCKKGSCDETRLRRYVSGDDILYEGWVYRLNRTACELYLEEISKYKKLVNIAGGCGAMQELVAKVFPANARSLPR